MELQRTMRHSHVRSQLPAFATQFTMPNDLSKPNLCTDSAMQQCQFGTYSRTAYTIGDSLHSSPTSWTIPSTLLLDSPKFWLVSSDLRSVKWGIFQFICCYEIFVRRVLKNEKSLIRTPIHSRCSTNLSAAQITPTSSIPGCFSRWWPSVFRPSFSLWRVSVKWKSGLTPSTVLTRRIFRTTPRIVRRWFLMYADQSIRSKILSANSILCIPLIWHPTTVRWPYFEQIKYEFPCLFLCCSLFGDGTIYYH